MKIGRNDPCFCGSGKKYKNCCIDKDCTEIQAVDNNDLLKLSRYGSEVYEKAELDQYSRFYIETTANEKFEIRKIVSGYLVQDIIPPVNSMPAKDYTTIELNDIQRQILIKHNPKYEFLNIGNHDYFDGIIKGGHFTWETEDGFISSKGTISKLFIRQDLGNYILKVNLFPQKDDFKCIDEFLDKGFSIYTQTNRLDITCEDGKLYFEGNLVFAILSIYDKESLSIDEMFSQVPKEYSVSFDIAIGKPFFILKVHGEGLKISIINEQIVDITEL